MDDVGLKEISIIIPTYNRIKTLAKAIDSALNQTYGHYEIIVVDDGSTDETGQFLKEKYSGAIRYLFQSNSGVSSARNSGIRAARNDLIAFLDSDDVWLPDKLENQAGLMADQEIILSYSNFIDTRQGKPENYFTKKGIKFKNDPEIIFDPLANLLKEGGCGITTPAVMTRKKYLQRVGLFDERLQVYEDIRMWARLSMEGKWAVISKPLLAVNWSNNAVHLQRPGDRVYEAQVANNRLEIFMETYAHAREASSSTLNRLREMISSELATQAKYLALDGNFSQVRRKLKEAALFKIKKDRVFHMVIGLISPNLLRALLRIYEKKSDSK
jgi:glycosyltransferase involved in cell wall biosynthesis